MSGRRSERTRAAMREAGLRIAGALVGLTGSIAIVGAEATVPSQERVTVELNKLAETDQGCRLTLVFANDLDAALDQLSLETVLFNREGIVERFLLLNARPLPAGGSRVQQFDIDGVACGSLGRVLVNDVSACQGAGLAPAACLRRMDPSSRTDEVAFDSIFAGSGREQEGNE